MKKNSKIKTLINNEIPFDTVNLIDDKGNMTGIISMREALYSAQEKNLDLVMVNAQSDPPTCKLLKYST